MVKQTVYLSSLSGHRELPLVGVSRERTEDVHPAPQVASREVVSVVLNETFRSGLRARAWFESLFPMVGESDEKIWMGRGFVRVAASSRTYAAEH